MPTQLPLNIQLPEEATFANFYGTSNQQLLCALKNTAAGTGEKVIFFWGQKDTGRSHLLQACCHAAYENQRTATYLPSQELIHLTPQLLENLESLDLVCIDDVAAIAGKAEWEEALFHLYNRMQLTHAYLVVVGHAPPALLGLKLPDLSSRLAANISFQLQSLSEAEKLIVLKMRTKAKGLDLTEEVIQFLLKRCPRELSRLLHLLEKLDEQSLVAQRKLTIPFVKSVLGI